MKLPQDLQPHFEHATLIVLSNHISTKFFLVGGDEAEELDGIAEPRDIPSDREGFFSGPSDLDDTSRVTHFIKKMADRTDQLVRDHDISHVHVVMPADIERPFVEHLAAEVKTKIVRTLDKDLTKEDILDVIRRLFA